ncbi:MAG TPA: TonB family protein [Verrucomicrobiota bacterium]|nr:TonB family protein [Verrucomicrobiota bacterium]
MNRLQIPCLLASTVFHAVLLALLVAGAGFATSRSHTEQTVIINFVPDQLIAAPLVGGGSPTAPVSPQKAPAQQPQTQTKTVEPAPPPQPKETKSEPPATKQPTPQQDLVSRPEPVKTAPRKIEVSKVPVVRQRQPSQTSKQSSSNRADEEAARQRAEAQRMADQRRALIGGVADKLQGNLSDRTVVQESFGPGGGGPTYAGYDLYVVSLYQRAFQPPIEVTDESATARVRIVIARDGTVVESKIISPSGVGALDRAVQAALDRVTTIGQPLPDEIKGDRHTIIIRFNLKTKRLFG